MSKKWQKQQHALASHEAPKSAQKEAFLKGSPPVDLSAIKHPVGSVSWMTEALLILEAALNALIGSGVLVPSQAEHEKPK